MHYSNRYLPAVISAQIRLDEDISWAGIDSAMESLLSSHGDIEVEDSHLLPSNSLGAFIKKVHNHLDLKYELSDEQTLRLVTALEHLYFSKRLSIPFQIKVLSLLSGFFKFRVHGFVLTQWRALWDSAVRIITRQNKSGLIANEHTNASLLVSIVNFLHAARHCIPAADIPGILAEAMAKLSDVRVVTCVEGLVMLVNCLPTNFDRYDEYLPQWVQIWSQLANNQFWDCYWLTLFCRARKHSVTFDWLGFAPVLSAKTRELLCLPNLSGRSPQNSFFPFAIPAYYTRMVTLRLDARQTALDKIAKLSTFVAMLGERVVGEAFSVTPPKLPTASLLSLPGLNYSCTVRAGAVELVQFLRSIRAYFHPSQSGAWSSHLGVYLTILVVDMTRLVAKASANKAWVDSSNKPAAVAMFDRVAVDIDSVKYVCGCLITLVFESLYGKNPFLLQMNAGCVKNLAALDPSFCEVILPFLMSALDPAAVNQSHQAPAALYALSVSFRYFLYPRPVVLPYLADLLKLSLNGLDANDVKKTSSTLALYSAVFAWIPLGDGLLSMTASDSSSYLERLESGALTSNAPKVDYSETLRRLSEYSVDWADAFVDKIVTLLESKEEKQKGKKDAYKLGNMIADTFETVLVAASAAVRSGIVAKVLDYLKANTPNVASKEWAKILDSIVWIDPERLPSVVKVVLDDDVRLLSCSVEKLSFRLRLLGGALRRCNSNSPELVSICEGVFSGFIVKEKLINHPDRGVRKVVFKLVKDLLRGKVSHYLLAGKAEARSVFGAPNDISTLRVQWHSPNPTSIAYAVYVLKITVDDSMTKINALLLRDADALDTIAFKAKEESVVSLLKLMLKSLLGAAEVLGDSFSAELGADLPSTGLNILNECTIDERTYLLGLRVRCFKFLHELHQKLQGDDELVRVFFNSPDVQKCWMKLVYSLGASRMANVKNVNDAKKWYNMGKQMAASVISKLLAKVYRAQGREASAVPYRSFEYWTGHDLSTKTLYDRLSIQHAQRLYQLSYASVFASLKEEGSLQHTCMLELVSLTKHEYEGIRSKAAKSFDRVAARFGPKLNSIVKPLLLSLSSSETDYFAATGAISLLSQGRILKRISGQWNLFVLFVENFCLSQTMISGTPEQDRREKLMIGCTALLTKYSLIWHHLPLPSSSESSKLMEFVLKCCGFDADGNKVGLESKSGIRYETLMSYMLIHLIGGDFPVTVALWRWCIYTLRTEVGQPSQHIALCGLTKLAHIAVSDGIDSSFREQLKSLFAGSAWSEILEGMSACQAKAKAGEDSPQWAKGIDSILASVEYQRCVLPRTDCNELDSCSFSALFKRETAALISNLFLVVYPTTDRQALETILEDSKAMVGLSEAEDKAHIVTRAELFAGAYRYNQLVPSNTEQPQIDMMLSNYLVGQIEKASLDACRIWAESVAFGFSCVQSEAYTHCSANLLDSFRNALQPSDVDTGDGFSMQAKALLMLRALLGSDHYASLKCGRESAIAGVVCEIVSGETYDIFSQYRTGREEIGSVLGLLGLYRTTQFDALALVGKIKLALTDAQPLSPDDADRSPDEFLRSFARSKHVLETACLWLEYIFQTTPVSYYGSIVVSLLGIVLSGCGHSEQEVSNLCRETSLSAANSLIFFSTRSPDARDSISEVLDVLPSFRSSSWRVKEHALLCTGIVLLKNLFIMSNDEKKRCKSIFVECFLDTRPELQYSALSCMTVYLSNKGAAELDTLAEAYTKNCGIMADRERRKRKAGGKDGPGEKPDDTLVSTVMTVISLINVFPFDMPACLPQLIGALVRLAAVPSLKQVISKAIQDFKRTHQDRWLEFKDLFTREQLEDLQGAGAADYFS